MTGINQKILELIKNDKNLAIGLVIILIPFTIYTIFIFTNLISVIYFKQIWISFDILDKLFPIVLVCFMIGYVIVLFKSQRFKKRSKIENIVLFNKNRFVVEERKRVSEITDNLLKLTPERKNEILAVLKEKNVNLPCPSCGNTNFSILDGYFIHTLLLSDTKNECDLPVVPAIIIMCNRCGHLSQHSIKKLGLLLDSEEKNGN